MAVSLTSFNFAFHSWVFTKTVLALDKGPTESRAAQLAAIGRGAGRTRTAALPIATCGCDTSRYHCPLVMSVVDEVKPPILYSVSLHLVQL